jgi:4,5:9,10-diseco-3-hydroxy-5,9,17-trioxoandrosta-1(10),2-diene-4-oate hydrolase
VKLDPGIVSNYVNVNGVRTHFVEGGDGEPLVFVHGAGPGAFGWAGWRQTIPELAKHFHVYAPDTIGFGLTDKPTGIEYTDQVSVDHLAGFLDLMCLDKVNLCGNSRGAYMVSKYAVDHPDRVKRMLMVSSGSIASAMGVERSEERKADMRRQPPFDGTPASMRSYLQTIVADHSKITDELVEARVAMAALPGADYAMKSQKKFRDSLKERPDERQRFELRHRLPMLTIPICMVWGAKDAFAPPGFADDLKALLPNVTFEVLENSGHQAQNDESDRFNEIALSFFRSADRSLITSN